MIINIRHTGIVVNDLEKMANFYRHLGFKDESRLVEKGSFIEQVVNIPLVKIEWIKLRSPDGFLIEDTRLDLNITHSGRIDSQEIPPPPKPYVRYE